MNLDPKSLLDVKKLMIARYPRFATQIASANLEFKTDLAYHTAATDGKNIYFDPDFLASLSDDEKLFIIAHELMHIKFEHMFRMLDKNGQMRDPYVWNIATDAIINANLERDGFKIQDGGVNMPEALNYNAEEFYQILMKQKEKEQPPTVYLNKDSKSQANGNENSQESKQIQDKNSQGNSSNESNNSQLRQQKESDDHSLWKKAFEERYEQNNSSNKKENSNNPMKASKSVDSNIDLPTYEARYDEKQEFEENREERRDRARKNMDRLRNNQLRKAEDNSIELGEVGEAKPILNWKLLLRREVEKNETIWSQRRSIAENNYAYRLEENDVEDQAETEVMIDVSGSVSLEMVKAFLRQLKPILKESKLKVGCFNEDFWGMVEIRSNRDIDNFKIPYEARGESAWTEDWDLAVRSFSKKREVNKIVFTDGCPEPGKMPQNDLKKENIIWLVYKNRDFRPCCGKVINIYSKDLQNMMNVEPEKELEF